MKKMTLAQYLVLGGLCLGTSVSFAELFPSPGASIAYISGGVGLDEVAEFRSRAKEFNLRLMFAESSGAFLAGVKVSIDNAAGTQVLAAESEGPLLYANLPPGRYRITASSEGRHQTRWVTASKGGAAETGFYWP